MLEYLIHLTSVTPLKVIHFIFA